MFKYNFLVKYITVKSQFFLLKSSYLQGLRKACEANQSFENVLP